MINFYKKTIKQFQDQKFWKSGFQAFFYFLLENLNYYLFLKGGANIHF